MNMVKSPTITDIARLASVSVGTASNVLTGKPIVSKGLVERVEAAAEQLGYRPNALASALRSNQTGVVAFIVPNVENAFFSELLQEIEHCSVADGKSVMFMTTGEDEERTRKQLEIVISRRVDGLIIVPAFDYQPALKELERHRIPIVITDRITEHTPFPAVSSDNEDAGYVGGYHLFEQGLRDIVFFGNAKDDFWILNQREAGFMRAASGFDAENSVTVVNLSLDIDKGREQAARYMASRETRPDAIFASSNIAAKSIIPVIQSYGWRIPKDVQLLVMDDFDALSLIAPGISVISQPVEEIAVRAWQMLQRLAAGEEPEQHRVLLRTRLIVRGSTGRDAGAGNDSERDP